MHHRHSTAMARTVAALATTVLALGACSSDDDGAATTPTTNPEPTASVGSETTVTAVPPDEATADAETVAGSISSPSLVLLPTAPTDATVVVDSSTVTTDRSVRRGGQSAMEQGQTFAVAEDTALTGVSFEVMAPDGVSAGQRVELALYEVGDTVAMVPSGIVAFASTADRLSLPLPEGLVTDEVTHLVFSFPAVALTGGSQYAVVLSFADGGGPAEMFVQHADGDALPDGVAISLEGEYWKANRANGDSAVTLTLV